MNKYYLLYKDRCKKLLKLEDYTLLNDYEYFKDIIPEEDYKEIILEKQRRKNKRYRVDSKIFEMMRLANMYRKETIIPKIVFGTINLNDKTLSRKENTYIRKIHQWLKKHFAYVILNKDYGDKTNREHYHFIALTLEPVEDSGHRSKKGYTLYKLKNQDFNLGHEPTLEIINLEDKKQIRNYLLKLNNHSTKATANSSRIRVLINPIIKPMFTKHKTIGTLICERYFT